MQATHHQQHQHQLQSVFIQPPPSTEPSLIAFQLTQPIDSSWQSSQAPAIHPALSTPPVVLAGGKRKLSDDFGSASNPRTSALDALRGKRQRRFRSAGSISDSDDDKDPFDSPRTPALDDETMEWTAESTSSSSAALTAAGLGPNQVCIAHFILENAESEPRHFVATCELTSPLIVFSPVPQLAPPTTSTTTSTTTCSQYAVITTMARSIALSSNPPLGAPQRSTASRSHNLHLILRTSALFERATPVKGRSHGFPHHGRRIRLYSRTTRVQHRCAFPIHLPRSRLPPKLLTMFPLGHYRVMQARKCGNRCCRYMASAS